MKLRFAVVNNTSYFELKDKVNCPYEGIDGVDYHLLTVLSKVMNFNYELVVPEDDDWGSPNPDGSWSGMIGLLHRKEADVALNDISMTIERANVIDYGFPYLLDSENFLTKQAGIKPKDIVYFYPFQRTVWICFLTSVLLCSISLAYFNLILEKKRTHQNVGSFLMDMLAGAEVLFGRTKLKRVANTLPAKILFWFTGLSMSVLSFSFNGILLSFLMTPLMDHQITTIQELAEASQAGKIKATTQSGTAIQFMLKNSEEGVYKQLGQNLRKDPGSATESDSDEVEKVKKGYVSLREKNDLIMMITFKTGEPEKYFISEDSLNSVFLAIAFRKGFDDIARFDEMILRIYQSGVYGKIFSDKLYTVRLKNEKKVKRKPTKSGVRPISIPDIIGVFWLIIPGYLIAILVFIIERCSLKKKQRKFFRKRKAKNIKRKGEVFPRKVRDCPVKVSLEER